MHNKAFAIERLCNKSMTAPEIRTKNNAARHGIYITLVSCLMTGLFAIPLAPAAEKNTKLQLIKNPEDLPSAVRTMYEEISDAARSGNLDELRDIFESNELAPVLTDEHISDPIKFWKSRSVDGSGRDIMATIAEIISRPPVRTPEGDYVWPNYARRPLKDLQSGEQIDLFRMAGARAAANMLKTGQYDFYELKIGADGTWHSFNLIKQGKDKKTKGK